MPTLLRVLGLAAAIVLTGTSASPADERTEKIKVVLIDGQNNHNWRATTPIVKEALEKTGRFTVDVSSNLKEGDKPGTITETVPFPPNLDGYQAVVSNYNGAPWPADFQKAFDEHVKGGKLGLVVFHAADNAFSGWPEYNQMIGMGWRGNKFGDNIFYNADGLPVRVPKGEGRGAGETGSHAFRVTLRNTDHPITKGMPREWMHTPDQLVHGLRGPAENVEVLATAYSDKEKRGTGDHELMMWTITYGKGRIFHTPMGHDVGSVRCIGFLTALSRGTEWAATGTVTLPIPDNFPTADKTSSVGDK